MTIVASFNFLKHLLVIADSRITYGQGYSYLTDDVLQKLYPGGNFKFGFRTIIGFSGSLDGAYKILENTRETARKYRNPPTATNTIEDLSRWIKFEFGQITNRKHRNISFLLAGVEPKRDISKTKPSWIPFMPQTRSLILKPNETFTQLIEHRPKSPVQSIGDVDKETEALLQEIWQEELDTQFKHPRLGTQVVLDKLVLHFMSKKTDFVGGMFQCAILDKNGMQFFSHGGVGGVSMRFQDGRYIQQNETTGETVPLISIFEWGEQKPKPGTFKVFENPFYRQIADKKAKKQQ